MRNDHIITTLSVEINEKCIRLIALRELKTGDLRFITTATKITTDLKRIGDLAKHIAEIVPGLNKEPP